MLKKNFISSLKGKRLNDYVIHVDNVSKGRFVEEINFELYLKIIDGQTSENPAVKGKYFLGRGEFYKPWLEIYYDNRVIFKSSKIVDLSEERLDAKLFMHLSDLLPPGSHIMVVYLNHEETRKGLEHGVPALATPLGYLLWKSGCTWFKDWYFAEGFLEGDIKLQGNKPLNEENRRNDLAEISREITEFLREEKRTEKLFVDARKRAEGVLKDIAGMLGESEIHQGRKRAAQKQEVQTDA
jgi:hypothetical protein